MRRPRALAKAAQASQRACASAGPECSKPAHASSRKTGSPDFHSGPHMHLIDFHRTERYRRGACIEDRREGNAGTMPFDQESRP